MPSQVWIQTQKENVQKVKLILEEAGQLSKVQKVKTAARDGYMILPTNTHRDEEGNDELGDIQVLLNLRLCGKFICSAADIVFLPSPSPRPESSEPIQGPVQHAVLEWLQTFPELSLCRTGTAQSDLLEHSPRRWSIYEPMLLFPSGSFQDPTWKALLVSTDETCLSVLWKAILHAVQTKEGAKELSHLAINAGIPSKQSSPPTTAAIAAAKPPTSDQDQENNNKNILRSPSGLIILHGDFGPPALPPSPAALAPTVHDFRAAFWVSCKQNGIVQTWAPRYTMFSRGNVTEKARLLAFHDPKATARAATAGEGSSRKKQLAVAVTQEEMGRATAVDLYGGIGYFAFSYARAGFGAVVCWEINPWSVEGLRRGCGRNGWGVRVLRGGKLEGGEVEVKAGERVVVFEEGNEKAGERIERMRELESLGAEKVLGDVLHVNCGLLPSSELSWPVAWKILCKTRSAWLHLHENVEVDEVETRRKEIEGIIGRWGTEECTSQIVEVEHVELVKTFAPGVWHCVFDVHVQPAARVDSSQP